MLSLLRTRRWLGFTALVIGSIAAFGLLSSWQWSRAEERRLERLSLESAQSAQPRQLPGAEALRLAQPWQTFSARGTYRPGSTVLARLRYLNGTNGYWVLAALELLDGRTAWVSRGWIPATGPATVTPDSPPLPAGEITIQATWQPYEDVPASRQQGMPSGMVAGITPQILADATNVESQIPGYLQATTVDDPTLAPVAAPEVDEGRNISYAVQWLIFAAVAIVGWWTFLRREAQGELSSAAVDDRPADDRAGDGAPGDDHRA